MVRKRRRAYLTDKERNSPWFFFSRRCRCPEPVSMAGVVIGCDACDYRGRARRFWAVKMVVIFAVTAAIWWFRSR